MLYCIDNDCDLVGFPSHLIIFFKKKALSLVVTLSLGKDGPMRACSSHACARTCWTTIFLRGSPSLSSSLREALPPMLWTSDCASNGPRCSMALFTTAFRDSSSGRSAKKVVYPESVLANTKKGSVQWWLDRGRGQKTEKDVPKNRPRPPWEAAHGRRALSR